MPAETSKNVSENVATRVFAQQLAQEREHVAKIYARLDDLREETSQKLADVRKNQAVGGHQNRSERDSFATHYEDRLAQLNAVDARLVFGRLDLTKDGADEVRYIGRLGIMDSDQKRLLMDWRAPEAGTFYQATAFNPLGVRRRRHLMLEDVPSPTSKMKCSTPNCFRIATLCMVKVRFSRL